MEAHDIWHEMRIACYVVGGKSSLILLKKKNLVTVTKWEQTPAHLMIV